MVCTPHDMYYELQVAITCSSSWICTYLCSQAKTVAVRKACGRVVKHAGAVHAPQEGFRGCLVLCAHVGTFGRSLVTLVWTSRYLQA